MKRLATLLVLALAVVAAPAAPADDPQALVEQTTERMLATLKKERPLLEKEPERIYDLVSDIVLPHFDFVAMSRWALGPHWREASRKQKLRFVRAFRTLLVRTYATALLEYTDEEVVFLPLRDDPASGEVTVRTEVHRSAGEPIAIHYRLHLRRGAWKVFDVTVDGISLVANYRTSFDTEVREHGLDALIARLEERAARKQPGEGPA